MYCTRKNFTWWV